MARLVEVASRILTVFLRIDSRVPAARLLAYIGFVRTVSPLPNRDEVRKDHALAEVSRKRFNSDRPNSLLLSFTDRYLLSFPVV